MINKLSHSQATKYMNCGQAYKFHYIDRIRPTTSHAALMFGTALDRATGVLLQPGDEKRAPEEIFDYFWRFQEVNGEQRYLTTLETLVYAKTDWDEELLTDEDFVKTGTTKEEILALVKKRNTEGFDTLRPEDKQQVNHAFWLCLKAKGHLMIDAFRRKVMPRLKTVLDTQKSIKLENEEGDSVIGYIDLIADVEGHGIVVLDVKTSARAYDEENSVIFSPQLSLYVHAVYEEYQTRKAGFIVLNKAVIKNRKKICKVCGYNGSGGRAKTCDQETLQIIESKKGPVEKMTRCNGEWDETIDPDIYVQFLVEEIPLATEELVIDNISDINEAIKKGIYTKNLANCTQNYGRPCDYINLCYKNDMHGLEKIVKK